ncbi:MAG: peptidylprolyl isomerase [Betaproteobacteria bacterium]|nr:peptidylprolyl isomerase [Betaproteobacteria bacterium]
MEMNDELTTVNGKPVTVHDVFVFLKATGHFRNAIYEVIEIGVIMQKSETMGVSISGAELQEHSDAKKRWMGLKSTLDWHNHCRWLGINEEQWNRMVSIELLRKKLQRRVIGAAEIKKYFSSNKAKLLTARLSRIVCADEAGARKVIGHVKARPDDFSLMARQHSIEEQTRNSGGYLGSFNGGILPAEIEKAVFSARPGEVCGPFVENGHWTLYRVEGLDHAELDDALRTYIAEKLFSEWLHNEVNIARA